MLQKHYAACKAASCLIMKVPSMPHLVPHELATIQYFSPLSVAP